jgi:hypothetical protein
MRFASAFAMAILGAVQLAILSMPLAPLFLSSKGPRDEFYGIAMLGTAVIIGGIAALVGFVAGLTIVLTHYRENTAARFKRVLNALTISIASGSIGVFVFAKSDFGLLWAVTLSGVALAIGLPVALRRPYQPEKRWGEE